MLAVDQPAVCVEGDPLVCTSEPSGLHVAG